MIYFVGNRHAFKVHCRREQIPPYPPHARHVTESHALRGVELAEQDLIVFHESSSQLRPNELEAISEEAERLWRIREDSRARRRVDDQRLLRSLGFPIVEAN